MSIIGKLPESAGAGNRKRKKKDKKKPLTGRERAQQLAKNRIGRGTAKKPDRTVAEVNKKNKESMRERARQRQKAFKAKQEAFKARKNRLKIKGNKAKEEAEKRKKHLKRVKSKNFLPNIK